MHSFKLWRMAVFLLLSAPAFAQDPSCDCTKMLGETVQKVSSIYAGFDDKINSGNRAAYDKHVSSLQLQAAKASTDRACYQVLKSYTDFFRDSHVGIWFSTKSSPAKIRRVKLNGTVRKGSGVEGIWATEDNKYRLSIIKDPTLANKFIAVTMASPDSAWVPGMVKAEFFAYENIHKFYRGLFYQADFNGFLDGFTLTGDRIDHWFGPSWYRQSDATTFSRPVVVKQSNVEFKILDKDFVYLKLGVFNQNEVDNLDSLIKANKEIIGRTKNLIFDLRGNPGGNSSSSEEMTRLIYTNPIIYPAWQYRSSEEHIKTVKGYIARDSTSEWAKKNKVLLALMEKHPGELVSTGDSLVRKVDGAGRYPERVSFLIDRNGGSSTEFFVFEGKQSKKVTTFGENTHGVMDYGDVQNFPLSCRNYMVGIPWGRNGWVERFGYRIDNVGFAPDVRIPAKETDWVKFVMNYWKNK